jgi:hypothetical protein
LKIGAATLGVCLHAPCLMACRGLSSLYSDFLVGVGTISVASLGFGLAASYLMAYVRLGYVSSDWVRLF